MKIQYWNMFLEENGMLTVKLENIHNEVFSFAVETIPALALALPAAV